MRRRNAIRAVAALVAGGSRLAGADTSYRAEIAGWRKNYDRDLRSDKGPLFLIARHNIPDGKTEIGSDSSYRIALPDRAPKRVGAIERLGDKIMFAPAAGISVTLNGKPVTGPIALVTGASPNPGDRLEFGDFRIVVSILDGICQLAVRDQQSPYLKSFHGAVWYPVNSGYRVEAAFTPFAEPKAMKIPDTTGRARSMQSPGYVTFRLNGETLRLEPVVSGNELFFMFKDRTSGHETYGVGRFLDSEMPKNGKLLLDFNKAYNPYCALNPYSSCPIPPPQNILTIRVEAGERYRGEH